MAVSSAPPSGRLGCCGDLYPEFCFLQWGLESKWCSCISITAYKFANWDPVSSQTSVSVPKPKSHSSFGLSPLYDFSSNNSHHFPLWCFSGPFSEGLKMETRLHSASADYSKHNFIHITNHATSHTAIHHFQTKLFEGGFILIYNFRYILLSGHG